MKKLIIAIALLTSVNSLAMNLQVSCHIATPISAECSVQNHIPRQLNCLVQGRGITKHGQYVNLSGEGYVGPNASTIIDITADNFDVDLTDVFDVQANCEY